MTAQIISETIFHGANSNKLFGGLPVLILVGDNYQLPGISEGAFHALHNIIGSKMTQKGHEIFLQCSEVVFQLKAN